MSSKTPGEKAFLVGTVKLEDEEIYRTVEHEANSQKEAWSKSDEIYKKLEKWVEEKYPKSADPFEYC